MWVWKSRLTHSPRAPQAPGREYSGEGLRRGPEKAGAEAQSSGSIATIGKGGRPDGVYSAGAMLATQPAPLGSGTLRKLHFSSRIVACSLYCGLLAGSK